MTHTFQLYKYTGDATEPQTITIDAGEDSIGGGDASVSRVHLRPNEGIAFAEETTESPSKIDDLPEKVSDERFGLFVVERESIFDFILESDNIENVIIIPSVGGFLESSERSDIELWRDSEYIVENCIVDVDGVTVRYYGRRLQVEGDEYMDVLDMFARIVRV